MQETPVQFLGQDVPLVKRIGYPLQYCWETWVQSLGREDPLKEVMAAYSSILSWEILWTEELGRLQSMGSQKSKI